MTPDEQIVRDFVRSFRIWWATDPDVGLDEGPDESSGPLLRAVVPGLSAEPAP